MVLKCAKFCVKFPNLGVGTLPQNSKMLPMSPTVCLDSYPNVAMSLQSWLMATGLFV